MTTTFNVQNHYELVDLVIRTHQIYCGIKGKNISLMYDSPPGRTDTETFISLPIEDPESDLVLAHEWQHIFFKSNLRARAEFATAYSEVLKKRLPHIVQSEMTEFIHMLVNGLDDIRVCSLWELIYPHSADKVQKRWKRIIINSGRYQQDLVMYLMGLGLGLEPSMDRSEWTRYKSVLKDAVEKVIRRGFPTCLLSARWIIESVLQDITAQHLTPKGYSVLPPKPVKYIPTAAAAKPVLGGPHYPAGQAAAEYYESGLLPVTSVEESQKQAQALAKLINGSTVNSSFRKPALIDSWRMGDMAVMPAGPDTERRSTIDMVRVALGVSEPHQVDLVLQMSQIDMDKVISELKNRTKVLTPRQRLLKGLEDVVEIEDISTNDVDVQVLTEEDKKLIGTMKHYFMRLMDAKKQVQSDSGTVLDPLAYIDLLNGSSDTDIFLEEESSKGFSALILLDMSGSMKDKWEEVAKACKVMATAMRFPCSTFDVWGFTSKGDGTVTLLHFEDPTKGYTGAGVTNVWGLTPLHIAIDVALRALQAMPGSAQHLIVLTDGYPTHIGIDGESVLTVEDLIAVVAAHIVAGRKKGVNVVGLVAGEEVGDEIASLMFGHRRFWERVPNSPNGLFNALTGLVRKAFVGYLRSR